MRKILGFLLVLSTACSSISALNSVTTIKGNASFVLGKNKHGEFKASLENASKANLYIYTVAEDGTESEKIRVKASQKVSVRIPRNTAIVIENSTTEAVDVALKVTGDTGLSMGYQN